MTSLEAALGSRGARALWKLAKKRGALARLGAGALGLGAGTALGVVAGHLADRLHEAAAGKPVPLRALVRAAPLLGGGLGISLSLARHSLYGEDEPDGPAARPADRA